MYQYRHQLWYRLISNFRNSGFPEVGQVLSRRPQTDAVQKLRILLPTLKKNTLVPIEETETAAVYVDVVYLSVETVE